MIAMPAVTGCRRRRANSVTVTARDAAASGEIARLSEASAWRRSEQERRRQSHEARLDTLFSYGATEPDRTLRRSTMRWIVPGEPRRSRDGRRASRRVVRSRLHGVSKESTELRACLPRRAAQPRSRPMKLDYFVPPRAAAPGTSDAAMPVLGPNRLGRPIGADADGAARRSGERPHHQTSVRGAPRRHDRTGEIT